MRKYPPAVVTRRVAIKDFEIPNSDIVLEKGKNYLNFYNFQFKINFLDTNVIIPIFGIHLDEKIYPKPHVYNPDRFLPEEVAKRHHFTFLPFGNFYLKL